MATKIAADFWRQFLTTIVADDVGAAEFWRRFLATICARDFGAADYLVKVEGSRRRKTCDGFLK